MRMLDQALRKPNHPLAQVLQDQGGFNLDYFRAMKGIQPPPGIPYDEWQQILSRMQAMPQLPPRINPFAGQR